MLQFYRYYENGPVTQPYKYVSPISIVLLP